jgi:hypothetical protein
MPFGDVKSEILSRGYYPSSPVHGNAFSRRCLENVMPIPEKEWSVGEDAYLNIAAPFWGEIFSIDEVFAYYRRHSSSFMIKLERKQLFERVAEDIDHQMKRASLIARMAREMDLKVIYDPTEGPMMIAKKIFLLLSNPDHRIIKGESVVKLTMGGVQAAWKEPSVNFLKRCVMSVYFTAVLLLPRSMGKLFSFWLAFPNERPSRVGRFIKSIK